MVIISLGDIRKGVLSLFLIVPTILLSIYLSPALQCYSLTGSDLWNLQRGNVPNVVIDSLNELRAKKFFFKYKLMNEVKSRIPNPELFRMYKGEIENQISIIPQTALEYLFLGFLALIYGFLDFTIRRFFPEKMD